MLYPTTAHLRDYLSWRQADVHVNNLFNTTFWALVNGGMSGTEAEKRLKGTLSADKNEILFSEFGINYNNEDPMFRKGTVVIREEETTSPTHRQEKTANSIGTPNSVESKVESIFDGLRIIHDDIIRKSFWEQHPSLLYPPDETPPRLRI